METTFYSVIRHIHSIVRWLLLAGLLGSVIMAISGLVNGRGLGIPGRRFSRITTYIAHLQLLVGIILFIVSPRVIFSAESMRSPVLRFFLVEHTSAMLLAVILITIAHIRVKKAISEAQAARSLLWFYLISLVLILILIPWPFTQYAGRYF